MHGDEFYIRAVNRVLWEQQPRVLWEQQPREISRVWESVKKG